MAALIVTGGKKLRGEVRVSGATHATVSILAASLLTDKVVAVSNVPMTGDVAFSIAVLRCLGVRVLLSDMATVYSDAGGVSAFRTPFELIPQRVSLQMLLLGPLLCRVGRVEFACSMINQTQQFYVNLYLKGLRALGAEIEIASGHVKISAPRLQGALIELPVPSVVMTQSIILASVLARGITRINNAATEPEVVDLIRCLNDMGADIEGAGSSTVFVQGVSGLRGVTHSVVPDRIEAGVYLIAVALTGGELTLRKTDPWIMCAILEKLEQAGAKISTDGNDVVQLSMHQRPYAVNISAAAYPAIPPALQAYFVLLNAIASGDALIIDNSIGNRFAYASALQKMGVDMRIKGANAVISGVRHLRATSINVKDWQAFPCIVLAGLVANGTTVIAINDYLSGDYKYMDRKLIQLGANITRVGIHPSEYPLEREGAFPETH